MADCIKHLAGITCCCEDCRRARNTSVTPDIYAFTCPRCHSVACSSRSMREAEAHHWAFCREGPMGQSVGQRGCPIHPGLNENCYACKAGAGSGVIPGHLTPNFGVSVQSRSLSDLHGPRCQCGICKPRQESKADYFAQKAAIDRERQENARLRRELEAGKFIGIDRAPVMRRAIDVHRPEDGPGIAKLPPKPPEMHWCGVADDWDLLPDAD